MILDVRNLQHFVTISLATAVGGEGDYARDLLASLRTVAGGFEELIYKLPPKTGYKDLEKKCEILWETLRNTPDLPSLLVSDSLYSFTTGKCTITDTVYMYCENQYWNIDADDVIVVGNKLRLKQQALTEFLT